MKHVSTEMSSLIEELQRAQHEIELAEGNGSFENQRPLVRVLRLELLNQMKTVSEHLHQLRWVVKQMLTKDCDDSPVPNLSFPCDVSGASLVEQVDSMVTAALGDRPLVTR